MSEVSLPTTIILFSFTTISLFPPAFGVDYDKATNSCKTPAPYLKPGLCTNIKQCPVLLNILKINRTNTVAMKFVIDSVCFYQSKEPVVCCPSAAKSTTKFPESNVCGLTDVKHDRVVGGQPAVLGAWPWIASLGYTTATKYTPDWLCGGALINERYVVTAAHCLVNIGRKVLTVVRFGELDLDSNVSDGASPLDVKVAQTIVHESYNATRYSSDIALVKLSDDVVYTKYIKPICLPFSAELRSNSFAGYTPFLAGWGSLTYKGPTTSALHEVQLEVTELLSCHTAYAEIKSATIDQRVICAGRTGKDACQGDSGGPLMLPRGQNFYLIGVVSYGYKCAEPGYPGIYTRVTEFVDWIDKNVES